MLMLVQVLRVLRAQKLLRLLRVTRMFKLMRQFKVTPWSKPLAGKGFPCQHACPGAAEPKCLALYYLHMSVALHAP